MQPRNRAFAKKQAGPARPSEKSLAEEEPLNELTAVQVPTLASISGYLLFYRRRRVQELSEVQEASGYSE